MAGQSYGVAVAVTEWPSHGERSSVAAQAPEEANSKALTVAAATKMPRPLARIVLSEGNEEVEHLGFGKRAGLVLHSSRDDETVAGDGVETLCATNEVDVSADDVDHLLMRMGVPRAAPPGLHFVAHQHHAWIPGENLARQSMFRMG